MVKRGLIFAVLVVLLSGLASAGFIDYFRGPIFSGTWQDFLTGNLVQEENFINYASPDGSTILESNPIYIEVSTSKKAECYYGFKLARTSGYTYFQLFKLTGDTYHYTSIELKDNDYEINIKCADVNGNTNMRNYFISVKAGDTKAYRPEPESIKEAIIEDMPEVIEEKPRENILLPLKQRIAGGAEKQKAKIAIPIKKMEKGVDKSVKQDKNPKILVFKYNVFSR